MRARVSPAWVLVWPPSVRLLAQVTKALWGEEGLALLSAAKSTSACGDRYTHSVTVASGKKMDAEWQGSHLGAAFEETPPQGSMCCK